MPFGEILVILFYKFVYVMLRLWFLYVSAGFCLS